MQKAPPKFVVIKDDHVFGIFGNEKEAFAQAYQELGNVSFLLRQIRMGEQIY